MCVCVYVCLQKFCCILRGLHAGPRFIIDAAATAVSALRQNKTRGKDLATCCQKVATCQPEVLAKLAATLQLSRVANKARQGLMPQAILRIRTSREHQGLSATLTYLKKLRHMVKRVDLYSLGESMSRSLSLSLPLGDRCGGSLRDDGLSLSGCMRETPDDVEGPGTGESSRGEADAARVAVAVGGPRDLVMVSSPLEALSLARREIERERVGRLAEYLGIFSHILPIDAAKYVAGRTGRCRRCCCTAGCRGSCCIGAAA